MTVKFIIFGGKAIWEYQILKEIFYNMKRPPARRFTAFKTNKQLWMSEIKLYQFVF